MINKLEHSDNLDSPPNELTKLRDAVITTRAELPEDYQEKHEKVGDVLQTLVDRLPQIARKKQGIIKPIGKEQTEKNGTDIIKHTNYEVTLPDEDSPTLIHLSCIYNQNNELTQIRIIFDFIEGVSFSHQRHNMLVWTPSLPTTLQVNPKSFQRTVALLDACGSATPTEEKEEEEPPIYYSPKAIETYNRLEKVLTDFIVHLSEAAQKSDHWYKKRSNKRVVEQISEENIEYPDGDLTKTIKYHLHFELEDTDEISQRYRELTIVCSYEKGELDTILILFPPFGSTNKTLRVHWMKDNPAACSIIDSGSGDQAALDLVEIKLKDIKASLEED
ncbi:hypothetical protein HN748_02865 [Candidatus Peregrinibacteria bacterium]|jgi:hypothetical protein|nr:hypothetical protein [Candidatus Peregrinibacteria bacterium]MBT7483388.1 hypothetical protein [Candidatus Peregrinibacteria bacterium]MBT7703149.1 hypothetical protein [Candidatus Peregrinibacteria bacterium]